MMASLPFARARHALGCALGVALAALAAGQEPTVPQPEPGEKLPTYGREVELVSVDIVVADKAGNPVTDLTRDDFVVLDEGEEQRILTFELVTPGRETDSPEESAPIQRMEKPRIATNVGAPEVRGRTFILVVDNIGMTPLNTQRAKSVVAAFLDKGVRPGDRVMLASTGGGAWWSATIPDGRDDLLAVLEGISSRRVHEPALDRLTDYEAMRIYVHNDTLVGKRVESRLERHSHYRQAEMAEATRDRETRPGTPGSVDLYVHSRAAETYTKARFRNLTTLKALERVMKTMTESRDRKSVVLVSEGFVYDFTEPAFKRVIESARHANAAVYFIDTRDLVDLPGYYSVQFQTAIDERNMLAAIADTTQEAEGSRVIARDTGGFTVYNTADLEAGITRIGRESRSYYLLGFDPGDIPRDGRFRKLKVKVNRKDVVVRARRGYYAPSDDPDTAEPDDGTDPEIQQALDSPMALDSIPLRLTSYVLGEQVPGTAQVLVVADVDISRLGLEELEGQSVGSMDTLMVVARRENEEFHRRDERVDLQLKRRPDPDQGASWYTITRTFDLPSGHHQARLVVRDVATRRLGTVSYSFEVPPLTALRLSTPVLTDTLQTPLGGGMPLPTVLARRTFRNDRPLYCRFDVYGARQEGVADMPRVAARHVLRSRSGRVLSESPLTEIEPTSLGAISRLMMIPLDGAGPGEYELVLSVRDERTGEETETVEPFTIAG
jgi:VWFA-related protein